MSSSTAHHVRGASIGALLALLLLLMALPASADAYRLGGERWRGKTITYYVDAKQYREAVRNAVRAWNASGMRIRFKAVSKRRAQLRIVYEKGPASATPSQGRGTLGYVRGGRNRVILPRVRPRANFDPPAATLVVAHEIGHVLGLRHDNRKCALMNTTVVGHSPEQCTSTELWEWRCRILERDDVRGAVHRYGGRVRAVRANPNCDMWKPPQPPTELSASYAVSDGEILRVSLRNPADNLPSWAMPTELGADPERFVDTEWEVSRDTCPTAPRDDGPPNHVARGTPGQRLASEVLLHETDPGRYCIAVWSRDAFQRMSTQSATAFFDIPSPPAEPMPDEAMPDEGW
jgi:hypothetical protein